MLTSEDISRFNEILHRLRTEKRIAEHVDKGGVLRSLNKWISFVAKCEEGYYLGMEDYTNELSGRSILYELSLRSDRTLKNRLNSELKPYDLRLRKILLVKSKSIFGTPSPDEWWYFGVPSNAQGELKADLLRMKLI